MSKAKIITALIALLILLIPAAALHYALPQVDVVKIVGTEVKRTDVNPESVRVNADQRANNTSDVYYINTTKNGKPRVYRNEDNWLYFKFDAANLQTAAKSLVNPNEEVFVAVKHYGWRNTFFSWFPNAIDVKRVDADYRHIPVFNIIILTLFAGLIFLGYRTTRRIRAKISNSLETRSARKEQKRVEIERKAQEATVKPRDEQAQSWLNESDTRD